MAKTRTCTYTNEDGRRYESSHSGCLSPIRPNAHSNRDDVELRERIDELRGRLDAQSKNEEADNAVSSTLADSSSASSFQGTTPISSLAFCPMNVQKRTCLGHLRTHGTRALALTPTLPNSVLPTNTLAQVCVGAGVCGNAICLFAETRQSPPD